MLVNLTWYQYFNVCRYDHVHKILTDEHKNLPIINDLAILKLVSRTGNFIPTPSANQLVFNVRRSLNIFCIRVYKTITKSIYRKLIERGAEEAQAAGLPHWRPKVFHHSDAVLKRQRDFHYSEANNTWRNNRGQFPALRSTLAIFESETIQKAEAICETATLSTDANGKISLRQKDWRFGSYDPTLMYVYAKRIKEWAQESYRIQLNINNCFRLCMTQLELIKN